MGLAIPLAEQKYPNKRSFLGSGLILLEDQCTSDFNGLCCMHVWERERSHLQFLPTTEL